jgi:hypothetical protein
MLKMATEADGTAPMKKPRSEAQVASLEKARAKARELRTQRKVIREKHGITDETDATPEETTNHDAETENTESESGSVSENENEDEEPKPAVVEKKEKPVQKEKLIKPKTDLAPKPKPQVKPQQRDEHVPIPQNFRMMSRHNYILFEE